MNSAESYNRHPNSYLPKHSLSYNINSETDGESIPLNHSSSEMISSSTKVLSKNGINSDEDDDDDDDVQAYGFPVKRRNRVQQRDVLTDRGGLY